MCHPRATSHAIVNSEVGGFWLYDSERLIFIGIGKYQFLDATFSHKSSEGMNGLMDEWHPITKWTNVKGRVC